jgi:hypothetical protein
MFAPGTSANISEHFGTFHYIFKAMHTFRNITALTPDPLKILLRSQPVSEQQILLLSAAYLIEDDIGSKAEP